jgi:D-alanine-D-alanine ligase
LQKTRVGIIFGGRSGEHEVSLMSAASIARAIDKNKYEVVPLYITRHGRWLPPAQAQRVLESGKTEDQGSGVAIVGDPTYRGLITLSESNHRTLPEIDGAVDVIFPVLHGTYGEDGTIQGLLELANIPYVGAGVMASAVGMDKEIMKDVFRSKGLPVVNYVMVKRKALADDEARIAVNIEEKIGYPCFVKPVNLGSSVGISKAKNRAQLLDALHLAAGYDRKILVEAGINCREIECSVLGNDEPIASEVGEVIPAKEFYDYEAKYFDTGTKLVIPAEIPDETRKIVQDMAVQAFLAMDCAGLARVDFFLSKDTGELFLNEINTIPGFTQMSMYPRLWEAAGIEYAELIDRLLWLAMERHQDKNQSKTGLDGNE